MQVPRSRTPGTHPIIGAIDAVNTAVFYLVGLLMAGMCLAALLQVLVRFVLTRAGLTLSVPWSEEVGRYLMIWLIFLGAAFACRRAQMIALTFVTGRVPQYLQRYVDLAGALICLAFFLLLIRVGWQAVQFGWIERSPVLQIPKAWVYLAMPVGAALMAVNTVTLLVERGLFRREYLREHGSPGAGGGP